MTTTEYAQEHITVEMTGTFDVAIARNRLRHLADRYRLPTVLRARAAAAISTITDLVLFKSSAPAPKLVLTIQPIIEDDGQKGVEFQFIAPPIEGGNQDNRRTEEWQLERACDEIGISHRGTTDYIVMRLWAKRGRV